MQPVCPEQIKVCRAVKIASGDSETGARLGGRPPAGVVPRPGSEARYLATLPLFQDDGVEVSIFLHADFDRRAETSRLTSDSTLVEVVRHPRSARLQEGGVGGAVMTEHPLVIGDEQDDWFIEDGEEIVESIHKIGGRPYLLHGQYELKVEADQLLDDGYRQILQLDFPGSDDAPVRGNWPFGDGMFHLFGKAPFDDGQWWWLWEHT